MSLSLQVCILADPALEENVPGFESIFCESDSENDDQDDDEDNLNAHDSGAGESDAENNDGNGRTSEKKLTPMEKHERRILKQRQRRTWENERDRVMFEYTQYSFYGRSSALIIFELAWKMSKDTMDLLWWAIVGITEQLVLGKIESTVYTLEIENIQSHVSRLTNKTTDQSNLSASKISFENDLHLALYRHWSVLESMKYVKDFHLRFWYWVIRNKNLRVTN